MPSISPKAETNGISKDALVARMGGFMACVAVVPNLWSLLVGSFDYVETGSQAMREVMNPLTT
jgi:hypothetical protein